jgi:hypothetical protein
MRHVTIEVAHDPTPTSREITSRDQQDERKKKKKKTHNQQRQTKTDTVGDRTKEGMPMKVTPS